jgi:hypothetical protein
VVWAASALRFAAQAATAVNNAEIGARIAVTILAKAVPESIPLGGEISSPRRCSLLAGPGVALVVSGAAMSGGNGLCVLRGFEIGTGVVPAANQASDWVEATIAFGNSTQSSTADHTIALCVSLSRIFGDRPPSRSTVLEEEPAWVSPINFSHFHLSRRNHLPKFSQSRDASLLTA